MTAEVLRNKTTAEWLRRLDAEQVPCAPVLTRPEVINQEQVRVNKLIVEYDHPGLGRVRQPRPAALFDATPPATAPIAPMLGEHGRTILVEHGYDDDAIDALITSGVMVNPPAEPVP
jgi:crotonobetainyl-CoA:carnitine CoA-transferase CaiB-like acyl-CoA transferase